MFRREPVLPYSHYPLLASVLLFSMAAQGAGSIRLDSSGFLRKSEGRGDTSSTLILGPEFSKEGSLISAAMDLKGVAFLQDRSSFTVEAGNLYVATSPKLMPHHQLTLGRRIYDWTVMEDAWGMGLWSARFLWNPLKPERIGLSGAFYSYHSAKWRVLGFATPLSPPERSYPIRAEMGRLDSSSPDWVPPYESLIMMNQQIPIRYRLEYPPMSELLLRPGAAVQVRYGEPDGVWAAATYGVMPMHQAQLAVDGGYVPSGDYVEAIVHPRTLFHHLMTGEGGYRGKHWSLWASASGEAPIQKPMPLRWQSDPMGPALLTSVGGELRLDQYFAFSGSYLGVDENKPAPSPDALPLNMPSRFGYHRAFQLEARWTGIPQLTWNAHWTYDLVGLSSLVSLDMLYQPALKRSNILNAMFGSADAWTFGVGTDLVSSASRTGLIGQYAGNDRIRGRISYAF